MSTSRALARLAAASLLLAGLFPLAVCAILVSALLSPVGAVELPDPKPPVGGGLTRVYDVRGNEIGRFREFEQHLAVKKENIPTVLKQAVIAAEDRKFYTHRGIDLRGILRALRTDVREREFAQGGSTITQQYVKLAYTGSRRTVSRKVREVVVAGHLDQVADKDEILFKYLSSIYLGEGAYGVGAAAESYFRKPVSDLTLSEAALLAGLIPAPSLYEPRGNRGAAERRRQLVLDQMLDVGYIDQAEHAEASRQRIWLETPRAPRPRDVTVIYPPQEQYAAHPYFLDYLRRYLTAKYGPDVVFRGGLEVQTTLDPALQAAAEKSVADSLADTQPPLDMALTAVEPTTGFVRAMVGGRDFAAEGGQVNLALGKCARPPKEDMPKVDVKASCWDDDAVVVEGGGTGRQPGSSWKPFVLAAALEKGISDAKVYSAPSSYRIPNCTGKGCVIGNFEGSAGGRTTLRRATHKSFNTVYAQVIGDVGVQPVAETAKKLGITSAWVATPETHGPSYALGVQEVSPLDMASAFGVFATNGRRWSPTPVVMAKNRSGKVLEDNRKRQPVQAIAEDIAYQVTDVLKGVITGGTGTGADIGRPAAGKTGTAQEFRDAWFVGYTPALSTSVWMGFSDKPAPLRNIKGVARVTGGSIPAATWKAFMLEALKDVPPEDFVKPIPPTTTTIPGLEPPTTFFVEDTTTSSSSSTTSSSTTTSSTTSSTSTSTTSTTSRGGLLP
ncbi:MAG: transglycosylase domain-containing protein [Actinobacteria bacterium]|nr:transglycosylase domain-containing protein [Actinomycetota bacterium]